MKVRNVVKRALRNPQPGVTYGAKMEGMTLNGSSVTVQWAIFAHKPRGRKYGKKSATA